MLLYHYFISYVTKDETTARKIAESLRQRGKEVWFAPWKIKAGDDIAAKIDEGLAQSRQLVLLVSQAEERSVWVKFEKRTKQFTDPSAASRTIIPVRLDQVEVPPSFQRLLHIDGTKGITPDVIDQIIASL